MLCRNLADGEEALAADLVRRSITELCRADYRDDPLVLARWLASHQPSDFLRWRRDGDRAVFLAICDGGPPVAVGAVAWRGEILPNYVDPELRFRGISRRLIAYMEERLRQRGSHACRLWSTHTARRFYSSMGYDEVGRTPSRYGTLDPIEMTKTLGQPVPAQGGA